MEGEGGGTAGRAAYPEAGPAESLHGRGRSLLQAHAGHQTEGEAGSFPPGRTGGGEDGRGAPRPALPAGSGRRRRYRPAALGPSGREAPAGAAPPRRGLLGRLRRPLEGPRPPLRRRGRPRATPGPAVAVAQRPSTPGLVSRGGRGAAAALLRPLKPGRCCPDVASCFPRVDLSVEGPSPQENVPLAGVTGAGTTRPPALGEGRWLSPHGKRRVGRGNGHPGWLHEAGVSAGFGDHVHPSRPPRLTLASWGRLSSPLQSGVECGCLSGLK